MKSDYKERIEAKSDAAGEFVVNVDGHGQINQRDLYLREKEKGFEIGVTDDPPGSMPPTKVFFIEFPDKLAPAVYDIKQLKRVLYADYSEWHDYVFIAESGTVTVKSYQDSPRRASGDFTMVGRLEGSPRPIPGPDVFTISGNFNLKAI
ncbi:hypothetical protein KVQ82_13890 [Pseudomonas sp. AO-1]|uniref:hypothetical protein n=1 Tax=Pseudomonas sp. AO-1 TaxID=2855434 RepID=UPI001C787C33|nr:hypothetical protein [Pseudomonas sp. AO-1]QXZ16937.1 hypothetical protein KVQ82_13890 [Pseudomonas sp. AO-1]